MLDPGMSGMFVGFSRAMGRSIPPMACPVPQ